MRFLAIESHACGTMINNALGMLLIYINSP